MNLYNIIVALSIVLLNIHIKFFPNTAIFFFLQMKIKTGMRGINTTELLTRKPLKVFDFKLHKIKDSITCIHAIKQIRLSMNIYKNNMRI